MSMGLKRLAIVALTISACVCAGATAGPVAFASELQWPLSEINLEESLRLGLKWGLFGGIAAAAFVASVDRKRLWMTAGIAVFATWAISFLRLWWLIVSSLG